MGDDGRISLTFNKKIDASTLAGTAGFSCTANGSALTLSTAEPDSQNANSIILHIKTTLSDNDVLKISYQGNSIKSADQTSLADFSDLPVQNNLPFHFAIPTTIEAESYVLNNGLQAETCTDIGGGLDLGYTTAGDYLEYNIRVSEAGDYAVGVRIACNSTAGKIELQQLSSDRTLLHTVTIDIPVTGGWQTWKTVQAKMTLAMGTGILKLKIVQPEFNINWIKFDKFIVSGIGNKSQGSLKVYPNPTHAKLRIELPDQGYTPENSISIRSIDGQLLKHEESMLPDALQEVYVGDLPKGLYLLQVALRARLWHTKFVVE